MLSRPGLFMEPAHMFPGAAFRVSNRSLGPASFCAPITVSLCAGSAYLALARTTVPDSSLGCAFQVRFPWAVYGDFRSP